MDIDRMILAAKLRDRTERLAPSTWVAFALGAATAAAILGIICTFSSLAA